MITIVYSQPEADAIPGPKHVWADMDRFVVYTGDDIHVSPISRVIPANEFRERFTDAEMDIIIAQAYGGDIIARRLLLKLQTASEGVELDSKVVQDGLAYLVIKGALTADREIIIVS